MRTASLAAALAVALAPAAVSEARPKAQPADAKGGNAPVGKAAPACGAKVLPLIEGNSWRYVSVPAPLPAESAIARIAPAQPNTIVITVKKVEKQGTDTVATLEEKISIDRTKEKDKPIIEEYAYESTITCTDKKFDISPNSFFFAGEPGGYFGLEITKLDRKATSWALTKGAIGENEWREDLILLYAKKPTEGSGVKLGSGKLELERRFTPQEPEQIVTKQGAYKSEKLGLITTGRVTLDNPGSPNMKPMELPAGWVSTLWIADNVGVVQSLNKYAHMYQLSETSLK
jgi:hypothetical protein